MNNARPVESNVALRVLIVEDEMLVAVMLEDILVELGCEIAGTAPSADAAWALAEQTSFDLAILDVNLNGATSYPFASALAARGVPFAFSTGYAQRSLPESFRDRPVLRKPFQAHEIREVVAQLRRRAE